MTVKKVTIFLESAQNALIITIFSMVYLSLLFVISSWAVIGAVVFVFFMYYAWELRKSKIFLENIELVKVFFKNNNISAAAEKIQQLKAPLKVLNETFISTKAIVDQTIEEYNEQKRLIEEENDRKKRQEIFNQIQSKKILDSISPQEFELIVLEAFARLGYEVAHTSWSGDEGIDGILVKGENKIAIQCKKQVNKVGQPAIRDFLGAIGHANCSEGIFITTSAFTIPAKSFVKGKKIRLMDGEEILDFLRTTINEEFILQSKTVIFPKIVEEKICPECGGKLRKRLGMYGFFWGCEKYPQCFYTENLLYKKS